MNALFGGHVCASVCQSIHLSMSDLESVPNYQWIYFLKFDMEEFH
jgi:hypothetical protein